MDPQDAIDFSREAITTCIAIGGPILAVSLAIGLLVSIFQAMTQLHDQSISFVPKILLLLVTIAVCLPWLSGKMIDFTKYSLEKPVVFQPAINIPTTSDQSTGQRIGSLNDPSFRFEWADSNADTQLDSTLNPPRSSMPMLRSADSRSQPRLQFDSEPDSEFEPKQKPKPKPRKAAPFGLPAFRQVLAPEKENEASDEF
jgi:flagellar biosynthetic protein FliQ